MLEFNVQLTGLDGNNKKYKDIVVEYLDKDTTGAIVTNLAEVMGMDASAAEAQAVNTSSDTNRNSIVSMVLLFAFIGSVLFDLIVR